MTLFYCSLYWRTEATTLCREVYETRRELLSKPYDIRHDPHSNQTWPTPQPVRYKTWPAEQLYDTRRDPQNKLYDTRRDLQNKLYDTIRDLQNWSCTIQRRDLQNKLYETWPAEQAVRYDTWPAEWTVDIVFVTFTDLDQSVLCELSSLCSWRAQVTTCQCRHIFRDVYSLCSVYRCVLELLVSATWTVAIMFVMCKSLRLTVSLCVVLGLTAVTEVKYNERTACSVDATGTPNKNNTSTQSRISGTHHDRKDRGL